MSEPNPSKLRIKPVYDVSTYGEDLELQLGTEDASLESITPSTADFGQILENSRVPIDDIAQVISDVDTIGLVNLGDDTDYDQTYGWTPDMSAILYKLGFSMAFGLNLSAWTSGTATIDSIQIIITEQQTNVPKELFNKIFNADGLTALGAVGTQILLFNSEFALPGVKIHNGTPLSFRFIINTTQSLVNTRQVGIIPFFCFQSEAIAKIFTTSVIKFHLHASLDHAFPVFRTEDNEQLLDFSGVGFGAGIG